MIINESTNKNDYEELKIVNPTKFISAIGGIMDSGLREADDSDYEKMRAERRAMNRQEIEDILSRNRMSTPPTVQEIKKAGSKIKVPWFLVGTLLSKAHTYGIEKDKDRK